jgi:hypothetical protein
MSQLASKLPRGHMAAWHLKDTIKNQKRNTML